ncbi:helix-turn-helix domain-containing protein [Maritalea mobilis]|uniref:helix-turn-helix domain-containing protein n=1 Tax=Maritalea mobilis TaxID=483324 RepID=UPI001C98D401|nr:helix-turn-helix transcriptional regulator [Maritalea mobilis]MBY6203172.1 helix-turn-helix domain-containing protein [Maritalea mobilis]
MRGDDLRAARLHAGLSRRALAQAAGLHPDTIRYCERKAEIDLRGYAVERMLKALGLGHISQRGVYPSARFQDAQRELFDTNTGARGGVLPRNTRGGQRTCGARTRKGTPCRAKALPGKTRCKFHGGASTGPRTADGRARISEAQRKRWADWRQKRCASHQEP